VTRYRNGDSFTSTQVYYERINTHTTGSAFNFTSCGVKDFSREVSGLENYPATKVRFTKGFSFATADAEFEFEEQRSRFFQENERRDDYMETREGMDLLNVTFKDYMITFSDPDNLPWYVSHVVFWAASFLLMSWPLRVIIEYKTAYVRHHIHKIFGTNYLDADCRSGHMTRANTIGSSEFELNLRNTFAMVPSYSEALLMDSGGIPRHICMQDANSNITSPVIYRAPRSVTFSTLSQTSSNGYISGFFSSAYIPNVQRHNSCTIVNGSAVIENNLATNSSHNQNGTRSGSTQSLRRAGKPPRPRKGISLSFSSHTVRGVNSASTISTPGLSDEYSVTLNPQTSTALVSRNIHRADDNETQAASQVAPRAVPEDVTLAAHAHSTGQTRLSTCPSAAHHTMSLGLEIPSNCVVSRHPRTPIDGPPPSYDDALWMQRPAESSNVPATETDTLIRGSDRRHNYHTIMETCL
jgi:hypothetical protein